MAKLTPIQQMQGQNQPLEVVGYLFDCPGCELSHEVYIRPYKNSVGASWEFNGDLDTPTFTPSINIKVTRTDGSIALRCHSFVENGSIRFLSDCTHSLANQQVNLPEQE
jgi:hypothetical protein